MAKPMKKECGSILAYVMTAANEQMAQEIATHLRLTADRRASQQKNSATRQSRRNP